MIATLALLTTALAGDGAEGRTLAEHRFLLPAAVESPFVTTHFAFRQGVGFVGMKAVEFDGYDTPVDLALLGVVESLEIGAKLSERLAWTSEFTGQVVAGANADSAFFVGAEAGAIANLGLLAVVHRSPTAQIGVRALVRGQRGAEIEPAPLIDALLAEREDTLADVIAGDAVQYMLSRESSTSGGLQLATAYAASRMVGLQGSLTLRGGGGAIKSYDGTEYTIDRFGLFSAAAGLSAELDAYPKLPFALSVEYRFRLEVDDYDSDLGAVLGNQHFAGVGAWYTGRDDLQLGALCTGLARLKRNGQVRFVTCQVVMRYIF